jgi:hypothetical protein
VWEASATAGTWERRRVCGEGYDGCCACASRQVSSALYGLLGLAAAAFSEVTPVWAVGAWRVLAGSLSVA